MMAQSMAIGTQWVTCGDDEIEPGFDDPRETRIPQIGETLQINPPS
jgi:hypothetical protein